MWIPQEDFNSFKGITGEAIPIVGTISVSVKYGGRQLAILVVMGGRDWVERLAQYFGDNYTEISLWFYTN